MTHKTTPFTIPDTAEDKSGLVFSMRLIKHDVSHVLFWL